MATGAVKVHLPYEFLEEHDAKLLDDDEDEIPVL